MTHSVASFATVDPFDGIPRLGKLLLRAKPPPVRIHSVEFTQAIQEWQLLKELKEDIFLDGAPPVSMV